MIARLRRMLHPPRRASPTRAGWFVFLAPMVLGIAAVTADNNLLFMLLGAVLGSIVLSGIYSEKNIKGVTVRLAPVGPVYAGEPARLAVDLTKDDGGDAYAFTITERPHGIWTPWRGWRLSSPEILVTTVPVLTNGHARSLATRRFLRRGPATLARVELSTTYPFALVHKTRDVELTTEVLVRPKRIPVAHALAAPLRLGGEGLESARRGVGIEFYGMRERKPNEDVHRVHALRSLALGRDVLIETSTDEQQSAWLGVVIDGGDPVAIERTLEHAQAALAAWDRDGFAVGLCIGTRRFLPGEVRLDRLFDTLASAEPEPTDVKRSMPTTWLVAAGADAPKNAGNIFVVASGGGLSRRGST